MYLFAQSARQSQDARIYVLASGDGPRVAVNRHNRRAWILCRPVPTDSNDWPPPSMGDSSAHAQCTLADL